MFSDGCYEVTNAEGVLMNIVDFTKVLAGASSVDDVVLAARAGQGREEFEDDFSLVEFTL